MFQNKYNSMFHVVNNKPLIFRWPNCGVPPHSTSSTCVSSFDSKMNQQLASRLPKTKKEKSLHHLKFFPSLASSFFSQNSYLHNSPYYIVNHLNVYHIEIYAAHLLPPPPVAPLLFLFSLDVVKLVIWKR